jgi:hypothetical protein
VTSYTERPQSIASPSTTKHTETQYNLKTEIQHKGCMTVAASQGAGLRRHEHPPRGRNSPNAGERPKLAQYPTDCGNLDIGRQLRANARACRRAKPMYARSKLAIPDEALLQPQAASAQVPIIVNSELARCSKRCPRLAGASSVAYPAWGEEVSKKPPGLRQAMPPPSSTSLRGKSAGASCARCLQAMEVLLPLPLRCLL